MKQKERTKKREQKKKEGKRDRCKQFKENMPLKIQT
jgi:hypothetical protein